MTETLLVRGCLLNMMAAWSGGVINLIPMDGTYKALFITIWWCQTHTYPLVNSALCYKYPIKLLRWVVSQHEFIG